MCIYVVCRHVCVRILMDIYGWMDEQKLQKKPMENEWMGLIIQVYFILANHPYMPPQQGPTRKTPKIAYTFSYTIFIF